MARSNAGQYENVSTADGVTKGGDVSTADEVTVGAKGGDEGQYEAVGTDGTA